MRRNKGAKRFIVKKVLSFDDVLIVPRYNEIESRKDVDVSTSIGSMNIEGPLIAANMPTICEDRMTRAIAPFGLGIIHRMNTIDEQKKVAYDAGPLFGGAVGIGKDYMERAEMLASSGCKLICIDVAHGHQRRVLEVAKDILKGIHLPLIIGNIATFEAAKFFMEGLPVDYHPRVSLKVGVGGGSMCTTRIQTGCGLPTLASVMEVASYRRVFYNFRKDPEWGIIADGGIKCAGDVAKSIAAGADAVMIGSLLAGTDETPGKVVSKDGQLMKSYRGAASAGEKEKFFGDAEYVEGAETYVPLKGKAGSVCKRLIQGLQSAMTYVGAETIKEFQKKAEFVEITSAGYKESLPHGLF